MYKQVEKDSDQIMKNDDETLMETDEPDFLSESDSEESDIDVGHELEDIITDINISYCNIVGLRKKYLKALEKYNEIEDKDKRDIFKKYVKLKGNLWMDLNDYNEEVEEKKEENGENCRFELKTKEVLPRFLARSAGKPVPNESILRSTTHLS